MLLLLLARKPSVVAKAAAVPLKDLTDAEAAYGARVRDFVHGLWPEAWGDWMLGPVSLSQLAMACGLLFAALLLRWLTVAVLLALGRFLRGRKTVLLHHRTADTLYRAINYGWLLAGLFCAIAVLELPHRPVDWQLGAWRAWLTLLIAYSVFLLYRVSYTLLRNLLRSWSPRDVGLLDNSSFPLLRDLLKVAALILIVLLIVETWGYNATTLLAGVGLGGLAIAFAAQDTIANVFGSIIIYSDRPFKVGDWVKIGGVEGDVEEIGIRSTRIRKFDKTIVIVPNKRVSNDEITNLSLMTSRRMKHALTLDISNPPAKLEAALGVVRQVLLDEMQPREGPGGWREGPRLRDDFWYANLTGVTATHYELSFLVFTTSTQLLEVNAVQEEILLRILRGLAEQGIVLAQLAALPRAAGPAGPPA